MVTIEAALALGSIVTVLLAAVAGFGALLAQIAAVDAAREAARHAAIAGTAAGAEAGRRSLGGRPGEVSVDHDGGADSMRARVTVSVPGAPGWVPLELTAEAVAHAENGIAG